MQTITPTQQTDLTTVEQFFDAWANRDLVTMAALVDPRAVIEPVPGLLYARVAYFGLEGVAEALDEIAGRWERFEMRVADACRDGDDVLAIVHVAFEKHGMSFDADIPVVCTLRDGLIASVADVRTS